MLGIVIVAENVPEAPAVMLAGVVAIVVVSNFIVTLPLAVKPDPEIVTEEPAAPEVGVNVTVADPDTLKIADPVIVPSVADTVWLPPAALEGITKVTLPNVPDELVVIVAGEVVTVVLSNFIVIVLLAPKPEPDTVTVVPTMPEVGDIVTIAPTLKAADAVLPLLSLAVTV